MTPKKRIPYNKTLPPKTSKQLGRGGPRDMQRRQTLGEASINMPSLDIESVKELLLNNKEALAELKSEIRKDMETGKEAIKPSSLEGIGLPFDVVDKKIREAMEHTEKQARERYESGLDSLNIQLNEAKNELKEKNDLIDKLRYQQTTEVLDLKSKITDLIERIKSGQISGVDYEDDRPILDNKIFIDPLSGEETGLDPHIQVDSNTDAGTKRDLKSDVEKLKGLLNKKIKPEEANTE